MNKTDKFNPPSENFGKINRPIKNQIATWLYSLAKPVLFSLNPEITHNLASWLLKVTTQNSKSDQTQVTKVAPVKLFGKNFANPIGLASGFDKTAELVSALPALGFGFAELGTFTPKPQIGNSKPRLFRYANKEAIVNRMGFNNPSLKNSLTYSPKLPHDFQVGFSLGKQKETPIESAIEDYLSLIEDLKSATNWHKWLAYVAVNISSPNTPGLRDLQKSTLLKKLISSLKGTSPWPIVVKLAPDFKDDQTFLSTIDALVSGGCDGLILTNTSLNFNLLPEAQKTFSTPAGISGKPIAQLSRYWSKLALAYFQKSGVDMPIIASGGIHNPEEARLRLEDGCVAVQVYTGLIYQGPDFIYSILENLANTQDKSADSNL